jgi:hypothetical protein
MLSLSISLNHPQIFQLLFFILSRFTHYKTHTQTKMKRAYSPAPWESDIEAVLSEQSNHAFDEDNNDFLLEITIHHNQNDDSLRLDDDLDDELNNIPFDLPEYTYPSRSCSPNNCVQSYADSRVSRVTPESSDHVQLPDLTELQRQYQHTLHKLARSMRQSDATRSLIKRQKRMLSPTFSMPGRDEDFFTSDRCARLEESRRKLFNAISSC